MIGTRVDYAYFSGDIDEVSVFRRALSAQQVQAHFEKGTGGDRTPPTVSLTLPEPDAFVARHDADVQRHVEPRAW